jgi:hypothetical protein
MSVSWPNLFNSGPRESQNEVLNEARVRLKATGDKVEAIKHDILRIRLQREFDYQAYNASYKAKKRCLRNLRETYEKRIRALLENLALHQYASILKCNSAVPSYILIVQSKALRNLHQAVVMSAQLKLVENQSKELIDSMKEHRVGLIAELSEVQKEGLNRMVRIQMEDEDLSSSLRSVLREQNLQIADLHDSLLSDSSHGSEERRPTQPQTLDELLSRLNLPSEEEEVSPTSVRQVISLEMPKKGDKDDEASHGASAFAFPFRVNFTSLSRNTSASTTA